jgi:hypothetical protein
MISYSKLLIICAFLASVIVLIVGAIKSISGMIIGGVVGLMGSALVFMGIMIQNSTSIPKESVTKAVNVNNPLPDV